MKFERNLDTTEALGIGEYRNVDTYVQKIFKDYFGKQMIAFHNREACANFNFSHHETAILCKLNPVRRWNPLAWGIFLFYSIFRFFKFNPSPAYCIQIQNRLKKDLDLKSKIERISSIYNCHYWDPEVLFVDFGDDEPGLVENKVYLRLVYYERK